MGKIEFTNHSGGAIGADMFWEIEGSKYGVKTIAYSFFGHSTNSRNVRLLTDSELAEGFEHAKIAAPSLKRRTGYLKPYVQKLLSRNWFQVKNADIVYAVAKFADTSNTIVSGGTGWAVQMSIDTGKPVHVFDQVLNEWYVYDYTQSKFVNTYEQTVYLSPNFAGIGTRELEQTGKNAITKILNDNIL